MTTDGAAEGATDGPIEGAADTKSCVGLKEPHKDGVIEGELDGDEDSISVG